MHTTALDGSSLLRRFHAAMTAMSAEALADLHHEAALYEFPFVTPGQPRCYRGRAAILDGFRTAWGAAPAQILSIQDVTVHPTTHPGTVVSEQRVELRSRTSGRVFQLPSLLILTCRDGLITHTREYVDGLRAAAELDRLDELVRSLTTPQY